MTAVAGEPLEGLRHEGRTQAVLFGDRFHHELEEGVLVGCRQHIVEGPVHLELTVRILVVVLVGLPAERQHGIADFGDDIIAAHHRLLIVAGLGGGIVFVRNLLAVRRRQEELGFNTGLDADAEFGGFRDQSLQRVARRLGDALAFHQAVGRQPGDFRLPRQLDHRGRIRHRQHVRMRRRQVQPCGKAGKAGSVLLHVRNRLCRHQLCALAAEQVGVGDHEIFDVVRPSEILQLCGNCRAGLEIGSHCFPLGCSSCCFD